MKGAQHMFDDEDLLALVECAAGALMDEEAYIRECYAANRWREMDGTGICCNQDERYYQFLIWRRLMKSFRWHPRTERQDRSDLALYDKSTNEEVARLEIKGWWSNEGQAEIPGILMDIAKLKIKRPPHTQGIMLVLTTYPKDSGDGFDFLAAELGIAHTDMKIQRFDNSDPGGIPYEFAIAGFFVH